MATPSDVPLGSQEIVWVFEHPEFGLFFLSERLANQPARRAEFEGIASQPAEGCSEEPATQQDEATMGEGAGPVVTCYFGTHQFAKTDDGREVFLTSGNVTTAAHWFGDLPPTLVNSIQEEIPSPVLEFAVIGPSESFSASDALAVAQLVDVSVP